MGKNANPKNMPDQWVRFAYEEDEDVEYVGKILGANYSEGEWYYWITCNGGFSEPFLVPESAIQYVAKSS